MILEQNKSSIEVTYSNYLTALVEGDSDRAASVIQQAFGLGWGLDVLHGEIICAAQATLGELWKRGDLSITQEHIATEISMMQLSWLRYHVSRRAPLNLNVLVSVPYEEQHILPARVVADALLMDGWQVHFPGLKTPPDEFIAYITKKKIDLLAFSITMKPEKSFITLLKSIKKLPSPPVIMIGGQAAHFLSHAAVVDRFAPSVIAEIKFDPQFLGPDGYEAGFSQLKSALGQRLVALRQKHHLSQQRLAEDAQIDRAYLSALENGKQNPSIHVLYRLAAATGVNVKDLLAS